MARGIDRIEKTLAFYGTSPTTTVSYPVYDAHGNMVRTLSKNSGGYTVTAARVFGAWGEVRNSSGPSASKGRYVANLGHVQDDESGLIYMRARYYEPGLGRFVSEDRLRDGHNWFSYCLNNPTNYLDETGKSGHPLHGWTGLFACLGLTFLVSAHIIASYDPASLGLAAGAAAIGVVCMAFGFALDDHVPPGQKAFGLLGAFAATYLSSAAVACIATMTAGDAAGAHTQAHIATTAAYFYGLMLMSIMISSDASDFLSNLGNELSHTNFFGGHH